MNAIPGIKHRHLHIDENFAPCTPYPGDEIYSRSAVKLNISAILRVLEAGAIAHRTERIHLSVWFSSRFGSGGTINEMHLNNIEIKQPVIQAELKPDYFEIIDGNHRMAKARRDGLEYIDSIKLSAESLLPFFVDRNSCLGFIEHWNGHACVSNLLLM